MRILIVIFILLTFDIFGQKKCNLDKYVIPTNLKVDSNDIFVYSTNDNTYFVAYYKKTGNNYIKYFFQRHLLDLKSLIDISENAVVVASPQKQIDSLGRITYFSEHENKYTDKLNYTYVINALALKVTSDKTFILEIKFGSGTFHENFEIEFKSKKLIKKLRTFEEKVSESKMTCVRFTGTDM